MELARWQKFSFEEQMGNIGSEIGRAISLKKKGDFENEKKSLGRAIELIDLTLSDPKNKKRLFEILRLKEVAADLFADSKIYKISEDFLKNYFLFFALKK
jgi:hypothetical protein